MVVTHCKHDWVFWNTRLEDYKKNYHFNFFVWSIHKFFAKFYCSFFFSYEFLKIFWLLYRFNKKIMYSHSNFTYTQLSKSNSSFFLTDLKVFGKNFFNLFTFVNWYSVFDRKNLRSNFVLLSFLKKFFFNANAYPW